MPPECGLEWCHLLPLVTCRVLVAGGDGTVGWVLQAIDNLRLKVYFVSSVLRGGQSPAPCETSSFFLHSLRQKSACCPWGRATTWHGCSVGVKVTRGTWMFRMFSATCDEAERSSWTGILDFDVDLPFTRADSDCDAFAGGEWK